jgi:hypothetical protein
VKLNRLSASRIDNLIEFRNRLAPTFSVLAPLDVIGPLRMMFVTSIDVDMIAENFSVSFDYGSESPSVAALDVLNDIDSFCILSCSRHASPLTAQSKVALVAGRVKIGNTMDAMEAVD